MCNEFDVMASLQARKDVSGLCHLRYRQRQILGLNKRNKCALLQDERDAAADAARRQHQVAQRAALRAALEAQMADRAAAAAQATAAKQREIEETNAALMAAQQQAHKEHLARVAAVQHQRKVYAEQQRAAMAATRATAIAAARECVLERAEAAAEEAAAAAAAATRSAARRAALKAHNAALAAAVTARAAEAKLQHREEREFVARCQAEFDAAEARHAASQVAARAQQRAKYERAGGLAMEERLRKVVRYQHCCTCAMSMRTSAYRGSMCTSCAPQSALHYYMILVSIQHTSALP
jgi:hypothetical protein